MAAAFVKRLNIAAGALALVACNGNTADSGAASIGSGSSSGGGTESSAESGGSSDGTSGGTEDSTAGPTDGTDTGVAPGCGDDFMVDGDSLRGQLPDGLSFVGAALSAPVLSGPADPEYASVAAREFNLVTPENAMKWGVIEPERGSPNYDDADAIVEFACDNAQAVRGHALVFHQQAPEWLDGLSPQELQSALDQHIDDLVGRYAGQVSQWDVVNEAVDDDGSLRSTVFSEQLGPQYIADAFTRARQADPQAALGYNDYGIAGPGAKVDAVYTLVSDLVDAGVPIDYVGFQTHVAAADILAGWATEDNVRANIRRFGDLGLDVYITEMDVRVADLGLDKWLAQREAYRTIVNACRAEAACKGVSMWGFTDKHSWVDDFFGADDPLPFDETYARKEAYAGILDGFAGAGPHSSFACSSSPPGAIVCDGAETLATWLPTIAGGGTLDLSTNSFAGAHAMLAQVSGSGPNRQALGTRLFDVTVTGSLFMRAYVNIPAGTPYNGLTIFGLNESVAPFEGVAFGVSDGGVQLSVTTAGQFPTGPAIAADTWTCVELEVAVGQSGSATLYVDDVARVSASALDTLPGGGYESANAGVLWARDDQAGSVRVDEIAVSNTRIGCN